MLIRLIQIVLTLIKRRVVRRLISVCLHYLPMYILWRVVHELIKAHQGI